MSRKAILGRPFENQNDRNDSLPSNPAWENQTAFDDASEKELSPSEIDDYVRNTSMQNQNIPPYENNSNLNPNMNQMTPAANIDIAPSQILGRGDQRKESKWIKQMDNVPMKFQNPILGEQDAEPEPSISDVLETLKELKMDEKRLNNHRLQGGAHEYSSIFKIYYKMLCHLLAPIMIYRMRFMAILCRKSEESGTASNTPLTDEYGHGYRFFIDQLRTQIPHMDYQQKKNLSRETLQRYKNLEDIYNVALTSNYFSIASAGKQEDNEELTIDIPDYDEFIKDCYIQFAKNILTQNQASLVFTFFDKDAFESSHAYVFLKQSACDAILTSLITFTPVSDIIGNSKKNKTKKKDKTKADMKDFTMDMDVDPEKYDIPTDQNQDGDEEEEDNESDNDPNVVDYNAYKKSRGKHQAHSGSNPKGNNLQYDDIDSSKLNHYGMNKNAFEDEASENDTSDDDSEENNAPNEGGRTRH